MDVPITYRPMNLATASRSPTNINLLDNTTAAFYSRYLMKRAMAAVKLTIPKTWSMNYVKYTLFCWGFGAVLDYPGLGAIFQGGTVSGRDLYYQPKRFMLVNPVLRSEEYEIGRSCALVKLQPDFCGIVDITTMFANRLALAYEAWNMNTQNSKLAYVGFFENKAAANTFKALFDEIQAGNPAAVVGRGLYDDQGKPRWGSFTQDLRANYIAPDISDDIRNLLNEFDSFVGIPNNPDFGKRERSVVDEVNANNIETDTLLDQMITTLNEGFEQANEMFGAILPVQLKAEKRYNMEDEKEVPADEN